MRTKEQILDDLENMNAQVLNGGFYQLWYNVLESEEDLQTLKNIIEAAAIGFERDLPHYDAFFLVLRQYTDYIKEYRNLPKTHDEDLLESRENAFAGKLDFLDDVYYKFDHVVPLYFEEISTILAEQDENPPETEYQQYIFKL